MTAFVHPSAIVETEHVGDGTRIWGFTHVMKGAWIGANCNVGSHCFIEEGAVIRNDVTIKNGNMIWEGVTIEDGAFVGPGVTFVNDLHPRSPRLVHAAGLYATKDWLVRTVVRRGATVGAGAVILGGRTIGEYAMVGAGSVVTEDVPTHALCVGTPATVRGWVCRCGTGVTVVGAAGRCGRCGTELRQEGGRVLARDAD